MNVFAGYARYYDLLYRDKSYREEADYVHRVVSSNIAGVRTVVELGCGTAGHAEHLAAAGWELHGVDMSDRMLQRAATRRASLSEDVKARLHFVHGDIRNIRLGIEADVVMSLFHVVSYQPENDDLQATFLTARKHLRSGGIFVFDVWYGPAVLSKRPSARVKELEDDEVKITRIAEPTLYANRNLVDVHYRIIAYEKQTGHQSETTEVHRMRYLFWPELKLFAAQAGFTIVDAHEWMTGSVPGCDTWGVCFVWRAS